MNSALLSEDFLEFDDWQDQEYLESTFSDCNFEAQLSRQFKSDDYFYRKKAFTETIIYIQNQQFSENMPSLLNSLILISNDTEPSLRCDLAESLISITKLCICKELKNYDCVKSFTVPCIITFLHDTNKQVRLSSHAAIIHLIENKLLDKELFFEDVWMTLEEMMVSYNPDELRTECFTLLVQISQLLDNCLETNLLDFSREFIASNDNLRKTCASYLCTIIDSSTDKYIMEWLEIFYKLSEDTSWYVKKFCIESAIALSKRMSHNERWENITNAYYNFLTDNKKWVTSSAFQNLGAYIATFADSSKSHCELSPDGNIINLLTPCQLSTTVVPAKDSVANTGNASSSDDSDTSNYNSFLYWKQPLSSTVSSVCMSLKDIDLNCSDQSIKSECGVPDLSEYNQDIIPMKLLRCYLNLIHESSDVELIRPCAFSMPAVMFTLGPSCWPYMRGAYIKLVQSISWKVRVSLASSIQHIFQIIKYNESAVNDVIWAYKEFIKDVDEVKTGLMSNISQLFLSLPIDRYPEVFEDFNDLVHLDSTKNWRYRVSCMEQLESVITKIEIKSESHIERFLQIFKNHWLPVIFTFVADEVCAVRISAMEVMMKIMQKLSRWKTQFAEFKENITEIDNAILAIKKKILLFSDSQNCYLRQLFLHSCVKIIKYNILPADTINECLIPKYLDMCIHDCVPNNRMIGGLGLATFCNNEYLIQLPESNQRKILLVYNCLTSDSDRDVRQSVYKLKELFESISLDDSNVAL